MKPFDKKTTGSIGLWWDPYYVSERALEADHG